MSSIFTTGLCLMVVILIVLTAPITTQKPALDDFSVSVPDAPITTWSGSSVSLPCELSPLFNAEPLEVRWYRSENSYSPALLYKDHKIQETPVDPRYRGRVSLTGGLERGNVSLTLERVKLEDSGEYVCRVSSEQWFDKASVFLTVNVFGGIPVLSVAVGGGGQVNITCLSEGWSPQPKLSWKTKEGTEIRNEQEVLNTSDPHGLVSVSSWLLYAPSYSDWLACTVSLSEEAKREGRILPHTAVPGVSKKAFIVTLVLLILSLVIICALCSVILWKRRGSMWSSSQKSRNHSDQAELEQRAAETENLIEDWHQVKGFQVTPENIILDEKTVHPAIRVNHGKRAFYIQERDTEKASRTHLHVFSKESFSSGQHYWEVKVKDGTTGKLSWYVGVAGDNVERRYNVPLTPQNGFWILSYAKEKCFQVNTDPQPPIPVAELTIVGVFLDCDRHTLSFYNVDTQSLLYTFTDVKTSNYFPLFSPGRCDKYTIRII
ncbi:butyrophilin subfamily 1 member A1-like [Oncorhynchus masou masou]|uniref:butyrophilin subfamily 1 member A1-like n=1 Tax=Oncorhynchus masou masou TaxID=90313 RepID=UPI00318449BF